MLIRQSRRNIKCIRKSNKNKSGNRIQIGNKNNKGNNVGDSFRREVRKEGYKGGISFLSIRNDKSQ